MGLPLSWLLGLRLGFGLDGLWGGIAVASLAQVRVLHPTAVHPSCTAMMPPQLSDHVIMAGDGWQSLWLRLLLRPVQPIAPSVSARFQPVQRMTGADCWVCLYRV